MAVLVSWKLNDLKIRRTKFLVSVSDWAFSKVLSPEPLASQAVFLSGVHGL